MVEMTPERWKQISGVLDPVFELEPDKRPAFLDSACSGDEELRREIDTLLASDESLRDFWRSSPATASTIRRYKGEP